MVKSIIATVLVCLLITQIGCDSSKFKDWVMSDAFSSKTDKTELEKQKDEQKFTQLKSMMNEDE